MSHIFRVKKKIRSSETGFKIAEYQVKQKRPVKQEHVILLDKKSQQLDRE